MKGKAYTATSFEFKGKKVLSIAVSSVHLFTPAECVDLATTLLLHAREAMAVRVKKSTKSRAQRKSIR